MDKHGNDHIEKYFQNLRGKASKFLDFPQHSTNCHLSVFKDRSTQNLDRSSIKAALRYIKNGKHRTRKQPKEDQVYE